MPMPAGGPAPVSPVIDLAQMRDALAGLNQDTDPYGRNFKRPARPDMKKMYDLGLRKFQDYSLWRSAVRQDLQLLRMDIHGIFPDDEPMLKAGILDDYESTGLVDEYNLAVSFLSGLNHRFLKHPCGPEEYKTDTRKVQLAAQWLYEMESRQHSDLPEMSTSILEPKILLAYGTIWKSRTLNPRAAEWESPFVIRYIDPAQVIYDRGPGGAIKRVWRIYNATAGELIASYGDFSEATMSALKEKYPDWDEDTELVNVCEYWDPWWRFVCAGDGMTVLPVTEHKYGEVPFTPGFGPLGEAQATRLPEEWGAASLSNERFRDNIAHKSVGFIRFMKKTHLIRDSIMTRQLYGQKLTLWPPYLIQETLDASNDPQPDMEPYPNQPNYVGEGREIKNYPFPQNRYDTAAMMAALDRDMATSHAPQGAYGIMDQSNISGTANKQALSAGRHLWQPWSTTLDDFLGRDLSKAMRLWQRLGNTVIYGQPGGTRPFVIPNAKPRKGEPSSFELDPSTVKKVGPHVYVKSDATDFADTVRANTFKILNESGLPKPYLMDKLYASDYGPEMEEEWREEQGVQAAMAHPKFMEIIGVPSMLASELEEAAGDEDKEQLLRTWIDVWAKVVVQPSLMEIELQKAQLAQQLMQQQQAMMMGGMPGQPGAPGGPETPPQLGAGGPSGPQNAPTNEQSYSEDQGPGSQTGIQGGPRGPRTGGQG